MNRGRNFLRSIDARVWFSILIAVQLALYVALSILSRRFQYDTDGATRPLVPVLGILACCFGGYLCSIPFALRLGSSRRWIALIFLVAVLMRAIVLPSEPIQEVDLYRYIWDGAVSAEGISPFHYPPDEVKAAMTSGPGDESLSRLASLTADNRGLRDVLNRVHFAELPTVYPPVSQIVFRTIHKLTPTDADVDRRVLAMKACMVVFDLLVMCLLWLLLKLIGGNQAWCIAYGWSPLVIKEFANSGHLDAIAICMVMGSIVCLAVAVEDRIRQRRFACIAVLMASGLFIGLGVGAKLYPVVLFPVMTCYVMRTFGPQRMLAWLATSILTVSVALAPMVTSQPSTEAAEKLAGLSEFLSRWEINDLLFMTIAENLRPAESVAGQPELWFTIVPDTWRTAICTNTASVLGIEILRAPFVLTRALTTLALGAIVLWLCRQTWRDPTRVFETLFLSLAWFWMLSPTQNPWYWAWALPLVPFARNRVWLLVSGLCLIYYCRFWFEYHSQQTSMWGLAYQGIEVFDFIVVWIEFAPLLVLLGLGKWYGRSRSGVAASK